MLKEKLHLSAFLGFLIVFLGQASHAQNQQLKLELFLLTKETSRDSNWQQCNLRIHNKSLSYQAKHGGRDPRKDFVVTYNLTQDQRKQLIKYIRKEKLNLNLKEIKSRAGYGISIKLDLSIQIANRKTRAYIEGRSNIWNNNKLKSNLKNKAYYQKVRSLLVFLKTQFGFKKIEI